MKVTIKDLNQQKFTVEIEPTETISVFKQKIAEERGWEPKMQKLIYSGKVLKDEDTIGSYKIEEKGFVVCVVNRTKAAAAASAAASTSTPTPATPARSSAPIATPAAPAAAVSAGGAAATVATPTPATRAAAAPGNAAFTDANAFSVGPALQEAMTNMEAMGFERSQISVAMRAAFNNPDRAVEYLLTGIPDDLQLPQAQPQQAGADAAAAGADAAAAGADTAAAGGESVNLFDLAAQRVQGGGRTAAGAGGDVLLTAEAVAAAAGGSVASSGASQGLGNLDFLRHNAQFQQLRQVVQQQPQMLEPILQQLSAGNPQLAQLIAQNSQQFLNLLGERGNNDAPLPPGAQVVSVTDEEREAIERLCRLGFDRDLAIQAYFACDRDEELAANFLFDLPDDTDATDATGNQ